MDDQSSAAVGAHQNTQGLYFSVIDVSDTGFLGFGTNEVRAPLHRNPVSTHGFLNTVFIQDTAFRADRRNVEICRMGPDNICIEPPGGRSCATGEQEGQTDNEEIFSHHKLPW